jgi:hypothetical protein
MTAVEWLVGVGIFIVGFVIGTKVINIIKNFKQQEK